MSAPRTLSEKGVALILLNLFAGVPVALQLALRALDATRADLVTGLVADFLAGRFDFTDDTKAQVKKLVEGKTGAQIAKAVGISLPSVQNIKKELGLVKARGEPAEELMRAFW